MKIEIDIGGVAGDDPIPLVNAFLDIPLDKFPDDVIFYATDGWDATPISLKMTLREFIKHSSMGAYEKSLFCRDIFELVFDVIEDDL